MRLTLFSSRGFRRTLPGLAGLAAALALFHSPLRDDFGARLAHPFEYRFRHAVGRTPPLDPRIVIYALGDASVAEIKRTDLSLDEWREMLRGLVPSKPRAVLIDKVFGMPLGLEKAADFVRELRDFPFPVIAGAFISPVPVSGRVPLPPDLPDLRMSSIGGLSVGAIDELPRLAAVPGHAYGPISEILPAFRHVGHLLFEGTDRLRVLARMGPDNALAHAAVFVSNHREWKNGSLYLDGTPVPMDADGGVLVDLADQVSYVKRTKRMSTLFQRVRASTPLGLPADAVVILAPSMHTGSTDFAPTAFGLMQGGYLVTAMVNSVLTGRWLRRAPFAAGLVALAGVLGLVLALVAESSLFPILSFLLSAALVGAGLASFAFVGVQLPWLFCLLALWMSAAPLRTVRAVHELRHRWKMRDSLTGHLAPEQVEAALAGRRPVMLEPVGRVVTVMFVDIVGFSKTVERQTPHEAFHRLKAELHSLSETVHRFGGVVDKSTGDGLLCFFGYTYDGNDTIRDHADQALRCAVAIQRESLFRNLRAQERGEPSMPLRIGINTAAAYLGDLGGERRAELTIIGHGVNFAKRLESACDSCRILVGSATKDMLVGLGHPRLVKRYIQIKHVHELVDAYECDPFGEESDARVKVLASVRSLYRNRVETRMELGSGIRVDVSSQGLSGNIVNYSLSGLGIRATRYLACGVTLALELDTASGLGERLRDAGLLPLVCEVRWGRPETTDQYLLGLEIKNLSIEQQRQIFAALQESAAKAARELAA